MNHVVIFCAIPPEMAAFTSAMPTEDAGRVGVFPRRTGQIAERRISLVLCGMGKVHAAAAAQAAIAQLAPDALLSCGTAGGLDPQLAVGDVVIGATAIQHDYGFVTPDAFIPFGFYIAQRKGGANMSERFRRIRRYWRRPARARTSRPRRRTS